MLKGYDHVIWDWNGTLLNDVDLSVDIINGMLRERFMPEIDRETYQRIFEFPVKEYYRKLGFDFSVESFEKLAAQYIEIYKSRVTGCNLHSGAIAALDSVANFEMSQSILSSLEHSSLIKETRRHKIADYFSLVRGLNDHYAAGKVEVGRGLMQELEVDPSRTVLIGDTVHDLEVASELGIPCILISIGHYSKQRLDSAHGDVIESLRDLEHA